MRGFKIAQAGLNRQITALEAQCRQLQARLKALPKRVAVKAVLEEAEIVRLAPEAKHLTDALKMVAYRADTALVRCLTPHYARTEEEGRALIREMLLTSVRPSAGSGPSSVAGSSPFPGESPKQRSLGQTL